MKFLVIGDIMLDVYMYGNIKKIAGEAPVPIVNITETKYDLGGAGNVAMNLMNLGAKVYLTGVIGNDDDGKKILELLQINNIQYNDLLIEQGYRTISKNRIYIGDRLHTRYDIETIKLISKEFQDKIIEYTENIIQVVDVVIISDYMKGVITKELCSDIINLCKLNNKKVFVDPKDENYAKYIGCSLIKPNRNEAELILGEKINVDNIKFYAQKIKNIIKCDICMITLDEDGLCILDENNKFLKLNSKQIGVINTVGAGDTLLSSFVFYYFLTNNLEESMKFAYYCSNNKVSNHISYKISLYDAIIYHKNKSKVISITELEYISKWCKNINKKMIFTNGCFDIMHYGHISYLKDAKKLGDFLIVGLNSDSSVKLNKGENRPINKEEYRIGQLEALKCVDFIVLFDDKTPIDLVKMVNPDYYVKGGDYTVEQLREKKYAKNTVVMNYINDLSTSKFVKLL